MDAKNFNRRGARNWNRELREISKNEIRNNNVEESTISKDYLEGFRFSEY